MRIRPLAVLCVLGALAGAVPAAAQPPGAQVRLARPPVEVVPAGQTAARPLAVGARLGPGDRVRTGSGGAAEIELVDGSLVRLGEVSDFEIERLDVDAAGQPTMSRFNLAVGQLRAFVARQIVARVATAQGEFSVRTATAVAAVRQTDFAVLHDATQVTRVYALAGAIETTATGRAVVVCARNRWTTVRPGQDPDPCQVTSLRDRRTLLKTLSFESATVGPGDLDQDLLRVMDVKLSVERMTGLRIKAGLPTRIGRQDSGSQTAPVAVTVTID
jgi:hypothetical protein